MTTDGKDSIRSGDTEDVVKREKESEEDEGETYSSMNKDQMRTRRDFIQKEKTDEKETPSPLHVQPPRQTSPVVLKTPSEASLPPVVESDFAPEAVGPAVRPIEDEEYSLQQI